MNPNKDIFNYSDYREFLRDYFDARKTRIPGFTFRLFAEQTGFSSASFYKLVMDGKRNLTQDSIAKIAAALRLNKQAAGFFSAMVFFNQASTLEAKKHCLALLDKYRKRNRPEKLLPREFDYLKKWYNCVIREMVELPGFRDDPEWIADRLRFSVKKGEAEEALRLLLDSAFLTRDENGKVRKKEKTLTTGEIDQQSELATISRDYHRSMVKLAEKAIADLPKEERSVTNTTLSLSRQGYELALKRINQLNYELLELAKSDANPVDQVYQVNINVFPFLKRQKG